jgi:hypothetical protein
LTQLFARNEGDQLWDMLHETLEKTTKQICDRVSSANDQELFTKLCAQWHRYESSIVLLSKLLSVSQHQFSSIQKPELSVIATDLFRTNVVDAIMQRIISVFLSTIKSDRTQPKSEYNTLKSTYNILRTLLREKELLQALIAETKTYYAGLADSQINVLTVKQFIELISELYMKSRDRMVQIVGEENWKQIKQDIIQDSVLSKRDIVIYKETDGVVALLYRWDTTTLLQINAALQKMQQDKFLESYIIDHIKARANDIVNDKKSCQDAKLQRISKLHEKCKPLDVISPGFVKKIFDNVLL